MRKVISFILCAAVLTIAVNAQKATNYTYKLNNGITVKTEKTWGNVWIQQSQAAFKPGEEKKSVEVNVRTMGDIITSGSTTVKLLSGGKEVKLSDAKPGMYDLKISATLSGKPGTISFDASGIEVKANMKTTVNVTLYEYQVMIDEAATPLKGLSGYESKINRFKGNTEQNLNWGIPSFYAKGAHDKKLTPDEATSDYAGKIKPGTYDVLITIEIAGKAQKVWLENFTMKPDVTYRITTNLNAGEITYAGTSREVKQLQVYPAGTADRVKGVAKPDKTIELAAYEPATSEFACRPGQFDILLNYGNGVKYEWRKGIVVRTGARTDVK